MSGSPVHSAYVRLPPTSDADQIMAMPAQQSPVRRWTEQELLSGRDAAPYGERWELVDGDVLVTPSSHWTHQRVVLRLAVLLDAYVRAHDLGEVFPSPLDVRLEPGLVLQPDVLVVPAGGLRNPSDVLRRLLLAVETLSPSSARHDRVTKRPHYQRTRVPEYWIVDDRSETIERWRPDDERPELLSKTLLWDLPGADEPLLLDLRAFFAEVRPAD